MRLRIITLILVSVLFSNCKKKEVPDTAKVDKLLLVTDSLLDLVQNQHNFTSDNFYLLIDDSLRIDSLAQNLNLPDSLGFYQYLEQNMNDFNEIIFQTQREIYFAKDQLTSLKDEFLNNKISKSEYLLETSDVHKMISFLKERVDSNIYLINEKYNTLFFSIKDSTQK
ncbi:MAG: hypothetical protein KAQ75_11245 [Bacteroidales bacterium]|nr:hypothetical protein [Bacteroidales bacterium]